MARPHYKLKAWQLAMALVNLVTQSLSHLVTEVSNALG
jgi:hypothetical protein